MNLRHDKDALEIEVPASLLIFLRKWSEQGDHKIDHTALSLFSHGLMSLVALNDFDADLVALVNPVLDDMVAQAPSYAHVMEVTLVREGHAQNRN